MVVRASPLTHSLRRLLHRGRDRVTTYTGVLPLMVSRALVNNRAVTANRLVVAHLDSVKVASQAHRLKSANG